MFGKLAICAVLSAASVWAASPRHAQWTLTSDIAKAPPGSTVPLKLTAKIDPGYHIYSMTTPKGGGQPTSIAVSPDASLETSSAYQPKPERKFDANFGVDIETFAGEPTFVIPV